APRVLVPRQSFALPEGQCACGVLHADPVVGGEPLDGPLATEPPHPGVLLTAEGRVGLVVDGGVVDVGQAGPHPSGDAHAPRNVLGEHRAGEAVAGVVGDTQGIFPALGAHDGLCSGRGPVGTLDVGGVGETDSAEWGVVVRVDVLVLDVGRAGPVLPLDG